MQGGSNKEMVSDFFLKGFGEKDLAVVDRVFASTHILRSPAIGTEAVEGTDFIKSAIEEFWREGGQVRCSVDKQIAEGDSVATSYTLSEYRGEYQGDHKGIMISRHAEGKIQESLIVAREVEGSIEDLSTRRKVFN
jgi:hypothetical protein